MTSPKTENDAASVRRLVTEAASSVGELVADHIRLARVELATDVRIYASAGAGFIVAVLLAAIGYFLAAIALALGLRRWAAPPLAFGLLAGFHLVLGGLCLHVALGKLRRTRILHEAIGEARRSVRTLVHPPERQAP